MLCLANYITCHMTATRAAAMNAATIRNEFCVEAAGS